jgi:hypothetical protein
MKAFFNTNEELSVSKIGERFSQMIAEIHPPHAAPHSSTQLHTALTCDLFPCFYRLLLLERMLMLSRTLGYGVCHHAHLKAKMHRVFIRFMFGFSTDARHHSEDPAVLEPGLHDPIKQAERVLLAAQRKIVSVFRPGDAAAITGADKPEGVSRQTQQGSGDAVPRSPNVMMSREEASAEYGSSFSSLRSKQAPPPLHIDSVGSLATTIPTPGPHISGQGPTGQGLADQVNQSTTGGDVSLSPQAQAGGHSPQPQTTDTGSLVSEVVDTAGSGMSRYLV